MLYEKIRYRNCKINLSNELSGFYGTHRSGWAWAIGHLKKLHNPNGIIFDSFIERSFAWDPNKVKTHKHPWVGFIHVPPNVPEWFQNHQSNDVVFKSKVFQDSYPYCKGLYTLSNYHKKSLINKLSVPINDLYFPTETPVLLWNWEQFERNNQKKIVQVGWYLRKIHAIFQLPKSSYKKVFLKINYFSIDPIIEKEREQLAELGEFNNVMYDTAETIEFIPDNEYDKLLSENILFLNLYDASANNAVVECIVRNTPILVNPIEAVKEYLGDEYPFYYETLEEAIEKAENIELVYKTHQYLKNHKIKKKLSGDYFLKSFKNSDIYKNLKV